MNMHQIEHTPLLFGHDQRSGIVAVEPAGPFMRVFFRTQRGVHFRDEPFHPFILVGDPSLVHGCRAACSIRQLAGDAPFRYQLRFDSWSACLATRDFLTAATGKTPAAADAPYLFIPDPVHQYLLSSGTTLFKGMEFTDLRCLTLDIETFCSPGYSFSNPERSDDRIISIACRDSHGGETLLPGDRLSEPDMLAALNELIRSSDPDVIIGHNIFRFDLDYIGKRARRHGLALNWGRNGSPPRITPASRWNLAERAVDYPRWDVHGRHIIDTYFLVLHYDQTLRGLESHGLKAVARHFGVAAPDRVHLDGDRISGQFLSDPQLLYRYNLDDVAETESIYRILGYAWFLQTRMFPYSFQNCIVRGNATKINALFLREYLHRGHSIPARTPEAPGFEGGYTELPRPGVFGPVVHCDVASLYPSLMLTYRINPARDTLGLFLPMLAELRRFRLEAKQAGRETDDASRRLYLETLQQVFKILINSFFGYLGAPLHNFSDPTAAAEVTRLGRVTIRTMLDLLHGEQAQPLEVDTDGIYFKPPPGCEAAEDEQALVARLSSGLPPGIDVELDGRYRAMFAYKAKNYALLGYDDRITMRGSSFRSRGMERYLREFLREAVELILRGQGAAVEACYERYQRTLAGRTFEIGWVARTETLNESPAGYRQKVRQGKRNPSAAFEIALSAEQSYCAGDQVSYYVGGSGKDAAAHSNCRPVGAYDPARPDVNVSYYLEKLRHLKKRLDPFLPGQPGLFD